MATLDLTYVRMISQNMVVGTAPPGNPTTYAGWCRIPYEQMIQFKIGKIMSNSIRNPQNPSTQLPNSSHNDPSRQNPQRVSNDLTHPRHTRPPNGGYNRKIGVLETSASGSLSSILGLETKFERTIRAQIVSFISKDVENCKETNPHLGRMSHPVHHIQKHLEASATLTPWYVSCPFGNNGIPGTSTQIREETPSKTTLRKPFHIFLWLHPSGLLDNVNHQTQLYLLTSMSSNYLGKNPWRQANNSSGNRAASGNRAGPGNRPGTGNRPDNRTNTTNASSNNMSQPVVDILYRGRVQKEASTQVVVKFPSSLPRTLLPIPAIIHVMNVGLFMNMSPDTGGTFASDYANKRSTTIVALLIPEVQKIISPSCILTIQAISKPYVRTNTTNGAFVYHCIVRGTFSGYFNNLPRYLTTAWSATSNATIPLTPISNSCKPSNSRNLDELMEPILTITVSAWIHPTLVIQALQEILDSIHPTHPQITESVFIVQLPPMYDVRLYAIITTAFSGPALFNVMVRKGSDFPSIA